MSVGRKLRGAFLLFGLDARKMSRSFRGVPAFLRNRKEYQRQAAGRTEFPKGKWYPCLADRYETSGTAGGAYFHQDLLVAQWLARDSPEFHVDVGSRVDGFVAHVASFREIEVIDIRPIRSSASGVRFRQMDLMAEPFPLKDYCDSLSCLHALEHFGLGRYGDPVNYDGYARGWEHLHEMLRPGGRLYFAVPIGPQRVEFDAHRVFGVPSLVKMMEGRYEIERFAYVDDAGEVHTGADPRGDAARNSFGCRWGCGIFSLIKRPGAA